MMETVPPDMLTTWVDMLVTKLSSTEGQSTLEEAAQELALLSESDANKFVIAKSSGALDSLVRLLLIDVGENVQKFALRALGNLATSPENHHLISVTRRVLDGLVPLLPENIAEACQSKEACSLKNLAKQPGFMISIGNAPTSMQHLVQLLQKNVNSKVQLHAMRAMVVLSSEPQNQLIIVSIDNNLTYLAELLKRDERPVTQELAAIILSKLAMSVQNKDRIANCQGTIDGLMGLLYKEACPSAQEFGALALLSLVGGNLNGQAMLAVARCPGVSGGLVNLLGNPKEALRLVAAQTLAVLMSEKQNVLDIASFPGFKLQGLLQLRNGSSVEQEAATYALANLAEEPEAHNLIVRDPYAMQGLVQLMFSVANNPYVDSRPAETMKSLTLSTENVNFIATYPGALQVIEGQFGNHLRPDTQQHAAETIANIAASCTVPGILKKMLPRILTTLVKLLYEDEAPSAQFHVLRAFQCLARSPANKRQIQQHLGVAKGFLRLVASLAGEAVQEQAAIALQVVFGP